MFRNLDNIRPGLKALVSALREDYPYASVLAVEDSWRRWSVSRQGVNIDASGFGGGSGYVVRVFDGVGCAEYSFNRFSRESIPEIKALIAGRLAAQNKALGDIDPLPTPIPSDEPAVLSKQCAYKLDPRELGDEAIIDRLSGIRTKALGLDERIMEAQVSMAHRAYRKVFISENRDLDQTYMWTTCSMAMMVSRGQELKYAFKSSSNLGGAEVLEQVEDGLDSVAKSAIDLLDSEPIPPGEYDCVCDPDTTGMIVHEAFGHGVEMDMFVKDRALGREYIDKYVASGLVTMHDGSTVLEAATMAFDDEGTLTGDTVVIDRGILKTGMCDALSAARLGVRPTGNGRRESYERKAYTRMTNTYFEAGSNTMEEMISSIDYGFLLQQPSSGMEDPKNWGIQCMVTIAREIKDGRLTGKIFSPIVLTGYVPDLLKSVSMMGGEVELAGGGFCGKGYKEWVKVSDGGPCMKARIRLG